MSLSFTSAPYTSLSKFILRRNARMSFVQLVAQRYLVGKWDLDGFMEQDIVWCWGAFDKDMLLRLCGILDQDWIKCECISKSVAKWEWARVCPVLRGILMCAVVELRLMNVDIRIVVSEYTKIAQAFYQHSGKEIAFIKGAINEMDKLQEGNGIEKSLIDDDVVGAEEKGKNIEL